MHERDLLNEKGYSVSRVDECGLKRCGLKDEPQKSEFMHAPSEFVHAKSAYLLFWTYIIDESIFVLGQV